MRFTNNQFFKMSNQSIKYGILLTKEQLDFLKDDRQGFHRMTAFGSFV